MATRKGHDTGAAPTPHDAAVLVEQVRQLYGAAPLGSIATFVNSLIVFFVARAVMHPTWLTTWLVAVWVASLLRVGVIAWFRAAPFRPEAAPRWRQRFYLSLVLVGLAWGSIAFVPYTAASIAHDVFIAFVLGGMAAGASTAFSNLKHGYAAFSVPALTPLAFAFAVTNDLLHHAMATMVVLFGTLLWWQSRLAFGEHRASLRLRFEKQEMIESLKAAKERAEGLNRQLRAEIEAKLQAEAELNRQRAELERLVDARTADLRAMNKELEEFAFIASHDLKAPLRAVDNLSTIIVEETAERLDEAGRQHLALLRERVKAMDRLIDGLLRFARQGRPAEELGPVELGPLLRNLLDELAVPPSFTVEVEEPLPTLFAESVQVRQIFQNLITNAIAHHDRERGHVWVRAHDADEFWELDVADDGPGIPDDAKERIFRMFATSGRAGHTGLGLAVVRKLVLNNGGKIEVADTRPRGATFKVFWRK